MGVTLEDALAMALRHESVMPRLGGALSNDLVVANTFYRQIATFAAGFQSRHGRLPSDADWRVQLDSLQPGMQRDGTREALQRLYATDISGYHPEFFAEMAMPQLKQGAANTARARMNEAGVTPELITMMAEKIQAITLAPESRKIRWPTLGDLHRQYQERDPDDGVAEERITGLAWRGRHVLLAGREKLGKSTLIAAGAVALTLGRRFLAGADDDVGSSDRVGRVLWLGMDEAHSEAHSRLMINGAMPTNFVVVDPPDPKALVAAWLGDPARPDLVVVDSLIEYARRTTHEMPGSGDAGAWAPVVRQLTTWAHDYDVAIVTVHHATKATGEFRDSGEIGAAVDAIVTMFPPTSNDDAAVRWMRVNGRRSITRASYTYAVRLAQQEVQVPMPHGMTTVIRDRYVRADAQPAAAPPSVRERMLAHVTAHPGSPQQAVLNAVGGDRSQTHKELKALVAEGLVREEKQGKALVYVPAAPSALEEPKPEHETEAGRTAPLLSSKP